MRGAFATALLLGLCVSTGTASAASVLPDLDQSAPGKVNAREEGGRWLLAFTSRVVNVGPGPLRLVGRRPDTNVSDMTVEQIVNQSDESTTTVPGVGTMRYVQSGGHDHWHLLDFERFELDATDGTPLARDTKQGFCLWVLSPDQCGHDQPDLLQESMGLLAGSKDEYSDKVAGNSVDITGLPAGEYILVHRVNPAGLLQEASLDNNASSVRLRLGIKSNGKRKVEVRATCPDTPTC